MVSSPNDANVPNLGSVSTGLGELSTDDANDCLGLGGTSLTGFQEVGVLDERLS
jgi:hypothetical protein